MRSRSVSQSRPRSVAYRGQFQADFDRQFNRSLFSRIPLLFRVLVGSMFVVTIGVIGFSFFGAAAVENSYSGCTVTNKDRTSDGEGGSDMRIYTEGCNDSNSVRVFSVADNPFTGDFASANTYAKIEIGQTYDFQTRGYRIPILSMFENIIVVTPSVR